MQQRARTQTQHNGTQSPLTIVIIYKIIYLIRSPLWLGELGEKNKQHKKQGA